MHEALALAQSPDAPYGVNPRVGCVIVDADRRGCRTRLPPGRGDPARRGAGARRCRRPRRGSHGGRDPGAVPACGPHRPVHDRPDRRRHLPGRLRPGRSHGRGRWGSRGARGRGHPGHRWAASRGGRADQPGLDVLRARRSADGDVEVRSVPRRPGRGTRRRPDGDHRTRGAGPRSRAALADGRDHRRDGNRPGRRSGTDRPARGLRTAVALRPCAWSSVRGSCPLPRGFATARRRPSSSTSTSRGASSRSWLRATCVMRSWRAGLLSRPPFSAPG